MTELRQFRAKVEYNLLWDTTGVQVVVLTEEGLYILEVRAIEELRWEDKKNKDKTMIELFDIMWARMGEEMKLAIEKAENPQKETP